MDVKALAVIATSSRLSPGIRVVNTHTPVANSPSAFIKESSSTGG